MCDMNLRKTAALLLIIAVCLSLCSCGYNPKVVGTITDPDGNVIDITCGQYLVAQYEATVNLLTELGASGEIDLKKVMDTRYEGSTIREYIKEKVSRKILDRAVTDYLYSQTDLDSDVSAKIYYDNYIQNNWVSNSDTMIKNGIGYDSFKAYEWQAIKANMVPYVLYGEGGEQELTREYVNTFISSGVGRFTYLSLPYRKVMDVGLSDDEKRDLRTYANLILAACRSADIPAHGTVKNVIADIAEEYSTNYQNMLGYYQDMESITYENQRIIVGDGSFTTDQQAQMFGAKVGEFVVVDGGDGLFIIAYRHALDPETDTYDNLINDVIASVARERFQTYIDEKAVDFSIELDKKAVKYYDPDKIVF